jgi:Basic region leucine zipper
MLFLRRKLKNRVAAQTARDRKKQHMNELEEMIAILQCENKQLVTENEDLRRTKATLLEENKQLKQRLEMTSNSVDVKPELDVVTRKLSDAVTESAVLDTPLQRETVRTSIQLTAAYYLAWLTLLLLAFICVTIHNAMQNFVTVWAADPVMPWTITLAPDSS